MYPIKRKAAMERMVMVIRVRESFFGEASVGLEVEEEGEEEVEDGEEDEGDMPVSGSIWTFIISKSTKTTTEGMHQV
jgi:hypothetical protein